jgi:threonine/homoserine/homoserine lactone efflux protein
VGEALADVVPLAVAIALSPFPVIPAILLLFTARPRATGGGFLAGWAIGVAGAAVAVAAVAGAVEGRDAPPAWAAPTRIVLGLALIALGVRQWLGRRKAKGAPAWMAALDDATPASALKLGLLLSAANPKIVVLAAAAGVGIGAAALPLGGTLLTVALFTAIASVTVALPMVAHAIGGDRALAPLGGARDWLEANNAAVMAVVFVVIGAVLLTRGIGGL